MGPSTTEKKTTTTAAAAAMTMTMTAMTRKLTYYSYFLATCLDGFDDDANRVSDRCYSMCIE
jgi:hypothetical protein